MDITFEKALLMSGNDYRLTPHLSLHHPTVGEMLQINGGYSCERTYWQYVQFLLSDPYSNMVFLDDIGKNFMECTSALQSAGRFCVRQGKIGVLGDFYPCLRG